MRRFIIKSGTVQEGLLAEIKAIILQSTCKLLSIEIKEHKNKRSLNQNAYYWGVVVPAVRDLFIGNGDMLDAEEVHDFLKRNVGKLTRVIRAPDNTYQVITASSAKITSAEFENYLEQCRAWAAGWGVIIPLPNEGVLYE
jgi:hypothetical protein